MHLVRPDDRPVQLGYRQAALHVLPFAARLDDLRVDHRLGAFTDVVDEDPALDAHLRRREAHAGSRIHGLDHLLGEADDLGIDLLDLESPLAQHWVAENPDRKSGHGRHFTGVRAAGRPATSCAVAAAMSSTARSKTSRFAWEGTR